MNIKVNWSGIELSIDEKNELASCIEEDFQILIRDLISEIVNDRIDTSNSYILEQEFEVSIEIQL